MSQRNSTPQPWADHACVRDRFVLDEMAFAEWLIRTFGILDRNAMLERLEEWDPLVERVRVDGKDYMIPDECYRKIIERE